MLKIFILVVMTKVNSGEVISFQEFNTLKQCQANAAYLNNRKHIKKAYCTEK